MVGRAWVVLDSSLSPGLKMALVCVDYMSRYDMRVSPPSESFGILHIYILCKVPDIFTEFFRHAFELQPAANLTVPISRELIRGEGAGRTVLFN